MDSVKEAADKAATAVDSGLNQASSTVRSTLAQATATAQGWLAHGETYWNTAKAHANETVGYFGTLEDEAVGYLKGGLEYCVHHPYVSYPAAAAITLAALPGVRRAAYRATLGRLRNPEAVVSSAEAKLSTIGAKAEEFGAESRKLQGRAQLAHEEMMRGYTKLKAARQELQRLESAVGRSERMAGAVLSDLRAMRQNPRATELRSEAALKLSLLRQQRSALQKEIKWIAAKDV
ncbi:hypothetical protein COO60DRAFT_464867 [Scenedesmus sp. NREL 46B-D3]|nr:hypothetical protein COO60DRAFT_464867 [Scenedesmus sp. NREL 46B-D3]